MEHAFASARLRSFYAALHTNTFSLDDMISHINAGLPEIAADLSLGRLDTLFTAPESLQEPRGLQKAIAGYADPAGYSDDVYVRSFSTAEGGTVEFSAHPKRGAAWTDADREDIDFLLQLLYVLCSRSRLMQLMQRAEKTDPLTGSLNSEGIQEAMAALKRRGELPSYVAVFMNIRNFKYTNQVVGPQNGNVILRNYSMMIRGFIEGDGHLARLGGDNFLLLVRRTALERVLRFLTGLTVSVRKDGRALDVGVSVKAGVYPAAEGDTIGDVMSKASVAYVAARRSRNEDIVCFKPEMLEKALHDKGISSQFPGSLSKNEFRVYYQPKVLLADGTLCGAEALTRWHAQKIIYPDEFIPVLESEGSIRNLDFYVLEELCRDIRGWMDRGIEPVRVSTNFSKLNLSNARFEDGILAVLQKHGVPPKYIELELTELSDYGDFDRLAAFVSAMQGAGFHVSIDDFGTGYSSMGLIRALHADVIKLDKSLIDNIAPARPGESGADARRRTVDETISRSIITMARELGMDVIAEGVETEFQAGFLRQHGCPMAQGFLYDRPLPHDDFERRLTGTRTYGDRWE